MAQGRSTKVISMIKWIRTRRLYSIQRYGKVPADENALGSASPAFLEVAERVGSRVVYH